ncbi:hypothetical protein DID75_00375 [Candidatus Marinamargulisbacteria bacterium SCGC AG-410-N11]|nr:hypothetical protein DID75_00375 [Candidatus Marinamargulisbacteria bacterium SCGC AG-410-N11]
MDDFLEKVKVFFGFKEEKELFNEQPVANMPEEEPIITKKSKPFQGSLIHTKNAKKFSMSQIKVEEPKIYEDSLLIATHLRENNPVIVNLKFLDATSSKRLIDFVCGTAYAINGHMMKIGENIFLFTPNQVTITNSEEKTTLQEGMEQKEKDIFFKKVSNS